MPGSRCSSPPRCPSAATPLAVLVESHEGRPTKIEGNPEHPASRGGDRRVRPGVDPRPVRPRPGHRADLQRRHSHLGRVPRGREGRGGRAATRPGRAGVRILTEPITSPTLADQLRRLREEFPAARVASVGAGRARPGLRRGAHRLRGARRDALPPRKARASSLRWTRTSWPAARPAFAYAREFAGLRRVTGERREMNRLYVVEPTPSTTGSVADHRLPLQASAIHGFALALAAALGVGGVPAPTSGAAYQEWIGPLARDLQAHRGASIVIVGDEQPPPSTRSATPSTPRSATSAGPSSTPSRSRASRLTSWRPCGSWRPTWTPARWTRCSSSAATPSTPRRPTSPSARAPRQGAPARSTSAPTTTRPAALCHWHIPEAHYLESWSDARSADGTVTIVQPLIAPLLRRPHGARGARRAAAEPGGAVGPRHRARVLARAGGRPGRRRLRGVLAQVAARRDGGRHRGRAPDGDASARSGRRSRQGRRAGALRLSSAPTPPFTTAASRTTGGSRSCPSRITKLAWDNAALVSPATAKRLGLDEGRRGRAAVPGARREGAGMGPPGAGSPIPSPCISATGGPAAAGPPRGAGFNAYLAAHHGCAVGGARSRGRPHRRAPGPGLRRRTTTRWKGGRSCAARRSRSSSATRSSRTRWWRRRPAR